MNVKKLLKRSLSLLLIILLTLGMIPLTPPAVVQAFGTSDTHFQGPEPENEWWSNYQEVYYGNQLWRVLDVADDEMFLLKESPAEWRSFHEAWQSPTANQYATSDIRDYLTGEYMDNFTAEEEEAISKQDVLTGIAYQGTGVATPDTDGDPVFLLSVEEAKSTTYFPRDKDRENLRGWLRNEGSSYNRVPLLADGAFYESSTHEERAILPALKLDLSSVLFSSVGYSSYGGNGKAGEGYFDILRQTEGDKIKLTLLDNSQTLDTAVINSTEVVFGYSDIELILEEYAYSNAPDESGYLSAILDNGEGEAYYQKLESISGTGSGEDLAINMANVPEGTYTLKLFTEQANSNTETDYASAMIEIEDITVLPIPSSLVTGVSLDKETIALKVGEQERLVATIVPEGVPNKNVIWSSDNPSVATTVTLPTTWGDIEIGVKALSAGTATITATTVDGGHIATCEVTVTSTVTGVNLDKEAISLEVGADERLAATVVPETAFYKIVTWTSSDDTIATFSSGRVTAHAVGTATITVTTLDGGFTATCEVTVIPSIEVTGVTLNKENISLLVGLNESLEATIAPESATNKKVTWTSSNPAVATVNDNGRVIAYGEGTTIITVTTIDGGFTATCEVTVTSSAPITVPATGVTLNRVSASLAVGAETTLVATVAPSSATNKNVTWTSSDTDIATVDSNGKVTAHSEGTVTITVKTEDGDYTANCAVSVKVPVTSVSLNKETTSLVVGAEETLTAAVAPDNASDKDVTWTSSNTGVATVDSAGKVTAIAEGTVIITVTTEDGNRTATCIVTVTVSATGVTLNKASTSLDVGVEESLEATVAPDNATNKNVTWTSSDTDIATVDSYGKVKAISVGSATITVTTVDGNHTATCTVTVTEPAPVTTPVTSVSLNKATTSIVAGSEETLAATVLPDNATNKNVTWSSSNNGIATIDSNGKVEAISAGEATITVTTVNGGFTATCTVTVTPATTPVTSVSLNKGTTSLVVGADETLTAIVLPTEATNKNVTWTSSDTGAATVDSNGKVTAIGAGEATITVTTVDGGFTATCTVTVTPAIKPVTSVSLNKGTTSLVVGADETLTATVLPTEATNKNVTWSSNNTGVATVDSTGKVTAVSAGSATITVTTVDGGFTATCTVTVTPAIKPVTSVSLNKGTTSLLVGANETLTATVAPTDATNQSVTWSSNNTGVATVDSTGKVTAISAGSATITVRTVDGNYTATCVVTVTPPAPITVPVTGVSLDRGTIRIGVGAEETLTATIAPTNATNKNVTWTSSNTAVATVDSNGKVRSISAGTATITVRTADGNYTATCGVTVTAPAPATIPVTGVFLGRGNVETVRTISLKVGAESALTVTVVPANATNKNVTWTSSNTRVATVDRNGNVKALRAGSATITVTTVDGSSVQNLNAGTEAIATTSGGFTATCRVTVTAATTSTRTSVTGVSLNKETTSLEAGKEEVLTAAIAPENASNKNVVWSSSDTKVATVNKDGKVRAVNEGTAVITVTTADGDYTATCEVTVTKRTSSNSSSNTPAARTLNAPATTTTGSAPATGDTTTIRVPIIALCSSVLCIAGLFIIRQKRKDKEQ